MTKTPASGVRVPPSLGILGFEPGPPRSFPLYLARVQAGFPSPADDFIDRALDLNEHLVAHPQATFFVRAVGDSMIEAGIHSGDILVVDRALDPKSGDVVIAALDGELTVKRLAVKNGRLHLAPGNPAFRPIEITEDSDLELWGTVTYVIHKLK